MRLEHTIARIYRAAKFEIERRVENALVPIERAMRRRDEPWRGEKLSRGFESDVIANPSALVLPGASEPGVVKPPTGEYKDLPISTWIEWSVKLARAALVDHSYGYFTRSAMLTEAMMSDDRIQSAFDGRAKGLTKCEPVLVPAQMQGGDEVVLELEEIWEEILPEEVLEEILRWAVFPGFCLIEVIWEPWPLRDAWVPRLKVWHPYYVYYRVDVRKYVAITQEGPIEVEEDDPKWLLFCPHGTYRGWILGRVRSCAIPWLVRQFALRDSARFSEVHGLPIRLGKYPAQAPTEDKARFISGLRSLGAETVLGLPIQAGTEAAEWGIELVEAKSTSWEAFFALRDACDSSITLSIRGTNLTTEVGRGNSGNKAAAEVHQDEDADYSLVDRRKLMLLLRKKLFRWYCIFNKGDSRLVPTRKSAFVDPAGKDVKNELGKMGLAAETIVKIRKTGADVDERAIWEKSGTPMNEDVEGQAKFPKDFGAEVAEGGSRCSNCLFFSSPNRCKNSRFIEYQELLGSKEPQIIPLSPDRYCCNAYVIGSEKSESELEDDGAKLLPGAEKAEPKGSE